MKQSLTVILVLLIYATAAQAQNFVALNKLQPPANFDMIHDEPVISDDYSEAHVIWAAPGFRKERQGAPVYEQIFVLEGRARISFAKEAQEVSFGTWIVIPANTPHTIEVLGKENFKILSVQRKPDA